MKSTYTILGLIGLLYAIAHIWWWLRIDSPLWIMGIFLAIGSVRLMFSND